MIITGPDLAAYLRNTQEADTETLETAAAAASGWVSEYCGRPFVLAGDSDEPTTRLFHPEDPLVLPIDDCIEVIDVEVDTLGRGDYETRDDWRAHPLGGIKAGQAWPYCELLALSGRWPCKPAAVVAVTAIWGWPEFADDLVLATLINGARLFKRKDSPEGVLGGFVEFGPVRVTRSDPDRTDLLNKYRRGTGVGV